VGGGEHLVEGRTLRLRATNSVGVLVDDFKTALFRQPPQVQRLGSPDSDRKWKLGYTERLASSIRSSGLI
jgi:hypothetical protein